MLYFIESPNAGNPIIHATDNPVVQTAHGEIIAEPGDWIIRVSHGVFVVSKPKPYVPPDLKTIIDPKLMMARIDYTNHRGDRRVRNVIPIGLTQGPNAYHPTKCTLLRAWDMVLSPPIEKTFALECIHKWEEVPDLK